MHLWNMDFNFFSVRNRSKILFHRHFKLHENVNQIALTLTTQINPILNCSPDLLLTNWPNVRAQHLGIEINNQLVILVITS